MKEPRKKIVNIPNALSLLRIIIAPLFMVLYFQTSIKNNYIYAAITLGVSGLSDIVDGFIARRFNMITDIGKVLDPIADKLTQGAVAVSLAVNHVAFVFLFILLAAKELSMLLGLIRLYKSNLKPPAAHWWGKISTVAVFAAMAATLIFQDAWENKLPDFVANALIVIAAICLLFSLFNYYPIFKELEEKKKEED